MGKILDFLRRNFKLIIGVAALVLTICVFFVVQYMSSEHLENSGLQKWTESSVESKVAAVQFLTADTQNIELIVSCVDKMATFEDSAEFAVKDAVKLCNMGIQLRENN